MDHDGRAQAYAVLRISLPARSEVLAEGHRAALGWVFVVNLPWTLAPLVLWARLAFAVEEPTKPKELPPPPMLACAFTAPADQ